MSDIAELVDLQLKAQGASILHVSDGTLIYISVERLEQLLEKARANGSDRACIFAKRGLAS